MIDVDKLIARIADEVAEAVVEKLKEKGERLALIADEEEKPKGKKSKPAPEVEEPEDMDLGEEEDSEDEDQELDLADVIEALKAYAKKTSRDDAKKILKKFKVKSVQDLKPDQYAKIIEACK